MSASERDPREELAEIAGSVRALVEWYEATGSDAVASDASVAEVLGWLDAGPMRPAANRAPSPQQHALPPSPAQHPQAQQQQQQQRPVVSADAARAAQQRQDTPSFEGAPPRVEAPRAASLSPIVAEAVPALSLEEKKTRLSLLCEEAKSCTACVLHEKRKQAVFSRGDPGSEICFVGEGPGAEEDALGEPFVGKAGQLLDKMIAGMGLQRDQVYICNIVKCRPPENREPLPPEVAACSHFLADQLATVKPKVIVTLGNVPLRAMFGVTGIMRARGTWKLYKGTTPVMPTYHPAYVLRNPTAEVRGAVWSDLKQVLTQIGRPIPTRR